MPSIDVVIPAYQEAAHVARAIERTLAQDYPGELLRVLVVDAGSSDGTGAIASRIGDRDSRVHVLRADRRLSTPEALNLGIAHATADVVARVDAHGWPEPDFLSRAVRALEEEGEDVACVGGRPLEAGESRFGRAFTLARGSRFGVGGSVYAAAERRAEVDTVPWGMYRRRVLEEAGGFDPAMVHGEDEELNWRIRRLGYRVVFDPSVRFRYVPRASLAGAYRQYRSYGEARVRVVAKHPAFLKPRHTVPALMVAGAAGLGAGSLLSSRARVALAVCGAGYCGAATMAAVAAARGDDSALVPAIAACFPALHAGYGVGTLRGAAAALLARTRSGRPQALSSRE